MSDTSAVLLRALMRSTPRSSREASQPACPEYCTAAHQRKGQRGMMMEQIQPEHFM